MEYGAIDLHKKKSQIRIVTKSGEIIDHRIATTRDRFTQVLWGQPRMRILVEASTESEWVAQQMSRAASAPSAAPAPFACWAAWHHNR